MKNVKFTRPPIEVDDSLECEGNTTRTCGDLGLGRADVAGYGQGDDGGCGCPGTGGLDDASSGDDVDERGAADADGEDASERRGSGGRMVPASSKRGQRLEGGIPTTLTAASRWLTTLKDQAALLIIVGSAAWWVRDGLAKIEHAIDRLNDRVSVVDARSQDHETRIRTLEPLVRPK